MSQQASPSRFEMATTEYLPLSLDAVQLLGVGETITSESVTLTQIDPLPQATITLAQSPTVSGSVITQWVDGSQLTEGYTYELAATFTADLSGTVWTMTAFIEVPAIPPVSNGVSRRDIRRRIGRLIGDMTLLTATSAGSTTQFVDNDNLVMPDNSYRGSDLYFSGGTAANLGKVRRITGSTQASSSVSWTQVLPSSVASGDQAEMWNARGTGVRPQEVNDAIREAHLRATSHHPVEYTSEVGEFDKDTGWFAIPPVYSAVYGIQFLDSNDEWGDLQPATRPGGVDYWVSRAERKVYLNGNARSVYDGKTIRILGYRRERELESDADQTVASVEWITVESARMLMATLLDRTPDSRTVLQKLQMLMAESSVKRTLVTGRPQPNTVWLQ